MTADFCGYQEFRSTSDFDIMDHYATSLDPAQAVEVTVMWRRRASGFRAGHRAGGISG
jgi:hypothetical protein